MAPKAKLPEQPDIEDEIMTNSLYSRTELVKVIADYFTVALPECGFEQDYFWLNVRLLLVSASVGCACYAQFGTTFPQDRAVLGMCVVAYFVISLVVSVLDGWVLRMSIMAIKIGEDSVFVDLEMPEFPCEVPRVMLSLRAGARVETVEAGVDKYFDAGGVLCQGAVFDDFLHLLRAWHAAPASSHKNSKKAR